MSTRTDDKPLFGDQHVKRYRETGGEYGHDWKGTQTLLLTTTGRRSGEPRTTPLIYGRNGDDFLIVASKGGADDPPGWYVNLEHQPEAEIQVLDETIPSAHARRPTPRSRTCGRRWWPSGRPTTTTSARPTARSPWWCSSGAEWRSRACRPSA